MNLQLRSSDPRLNNDETDEILWVFEISKSPPNPIRKLFRLHEATHNVLILRRVQVAEHSPFFRRIGVGVVDASAGEFEKMEPVQLVLI